MSRTGCHGACGVLVSARARSTCGELVLFWVLTKLDVFDKCSHHWLVMIVTINAHIC